MYLIESAIKDGLYLNLDGGNKADGTKVLTRYSPLKLSGENRLSLISSVQSGTLRTMIQPLTGPSSTSESETPARKSTTSSTAPPERT